jgi:hypothetical protein
MANLAVVQRAETTALEALQKEFVIYRGNGELGVIELASLRPKPGARVAPQLSIFHKSAATTLLLRYIETLDVAVASPKSVIEEFWVSPATTVYDSVTFDPSCKSATTLNLWIGSTSNASPGPWPVIEQFLREVICSNDSELYKYLLNILAHALQRPSEKPGVILILLGGQGVGKGTLETLLRRIWSLTTLLVNRVEMIVGAFNGVMERAFIVFLDEAMFHGDRKSTEALKSIVTSEFITINEKHQPARQIPSVHRFFAASNSYHFAATEHDDRRAVYIPVSGARQGDHKYWDDVHSAIRGGDAEYFADFLWKRDISSFQPRERPKSRELIRQKILTLSGFDHFWFELLSNVGPACSEGHRMTPVEWENEQFLATRTLLDQYELFTKGTRSYRAVGSHDLGDALRRLCPSARSERRQVGGKRQHGYFIPSLEIARAEFEKHIGGNVEWPPD